MINRYLILLALIFFAGCAVKQPAVIVTPEYPEPEKRGIYHKVQKGQTLWKIANTYNVAISDIVRANRIPNAAQIEENQLIFIPGAYEEQTFTVEPDTNPTEFVWPIKGKVVSHFRDRRGKSLNKGINIKAARGEGVKASRGGRVVFSDHLPGYGPTVIIDHDDGFYSVYAQNSRLLVKLGDKVPKHKIISEVGGEDRLAYLHFQIRMNSAERNPLFYLP